MGKFIVGSLFMLLSLVLVAQEGALPADLRQHNLTQFNSSLWNPTFSLDRNMPRSLSVWTRWQWQSIDADPSTVFLNYTQKLGNRSAAGLGFLQHNTGILLNTGGVLNYAYALELGAESDLIFGVNVFAFQQELADPSLALESGSPLAMGERNIIAQFTPGLQIRAKRFRMGMAVENALEYNFSNSDRESSERIFSAVVGNDFPVYLLDTVSYLRPMAYVRATSNADTQYGLTMRFHNPKFWLQGGYNSFYGVSGGAGATILKKVSVGALVEIGVDDAIGNEDPTFEIVASYFFGEQKFEEKEKEEKLSPEEKMAQIAERRRLEEAEKERQRLEEERRREQARQDSIANVRSALLAAAKEQARLDSIARVAREKEVEVQPNERYEEVVTADGLEPGFYLIANVFGTQRYFDNFMDALRGRGLDPKSFFRSLNGYNYVYLKRYDTIEEARNARDSGFNGSYTEELWIFRVRGQ